MSGTKRPHPPRSAQPLRHGHTKSLDPDRLGDHGLSANLIAVLPDFGLAYETDENHGWELGQVIQGA